MRTLISKMNKGIVLGCYGHLLHWVAGFVVVFLLPSAHTTSFSLLKSWDFFKISYINKPRLGRSLKGELDIANLKPHYTANEKLCVIHDHPVINFKLIKELANLKFFYHMETRSSGGALCTTSLVNSHKMCRFTLARCLNSRVLEGVVSENCYTLEPCYSKCGPQTKEPKNHLGPFWKCRI